MNLKDSSFTQSVSMLISNSFTSKPHCPLVQTNLVHIVGINIKKHTVQLPSIDKKGFKNESSCFKFSELYK